MRVLNGWERFRLRYLTPRRHSVSYLEKRIDEVFSILEDPFWTFSEQSDLIMQITDKVRLVDAGFSAIILLIRLEKSRARKEQIFNERFIPMVNLRASIHRKTTERLFDRQTGKVREHFLVASDPWSNYMVNVRVQNVVLEWLKQCDEGFDALDRTRRELLSDAVEP